MITINLGVFILSAFLGSLVAALLVNAIENRKK